MSSSSPLFIGVDGGATVVKAWAIVEREGFLAATGERVACEHETLPGFAPVPLALQLEPAAAEPPPEPDEPDEPDESDESGESGESGESHGPEGLEDAQAWVVVHAAADAVARVAEREGAPAVRLGVCMPGVPTPDGRGIRAMRNGPRLPRFLARLEECLAVRGVALAGRPERLWSDGEAAVAGEEHGVDGALRGVRTALVIGCGTGVAEGWKLAGRCLARDAAASRFTPAWELAAEGRPFEDVISMRAMNAEYRRRAPAATGFPEAAAVRGDALARALLVETADAFAQLLYLRMAALAESEPGAILERIVVGQRSARLLADPALAPWFGEPLRNRLAALLREAQDGAMLAGYLAGGHPDPGLVVPSRLPAAPAIGAVALEMGLVVGA